MKRTIDFIKNPPAFDPASEQDDFTQGLMLVVATCLTQMAEVFLEKHFEQYCETQELKSKNLLKTLIFNKFERISNATNKSFREGQMLELITQDVSQAEQIFSMFAGLSKLPVKFGFASWMLATKFGLSFALSLVPVALSFFINRAMSLRRKQLSKELKRIRDKKANVMNEVLSNTKVLKLHGWTSMFKERLLKARDDEKSVQNQLSRHDSIKQAINHMLPNLTPVICFTSFIYLQH